MTNKAPHTHKSIHTKCGGGGGGAGVNPEERGQEVCDKQVKNRPEKWDFKGSQTQEKKLVLASSLFKMWQ